jgi:hypothetical protein
MEEGRFQNAREAVESKYPLDPASATKSGDCRELLYHLIKG